MLFILQKYNWEQLDTSLFKTSAQSYLNELGWNELNWQHREEQTEYLSKYIQHLNHLNIEDIIQAPASFYTPWRNLNYRHRAAAESKCIPLLRSLL